MKVIVSKPVGLNFYTIFLFLFPTLTILYVLYLSHFDITYALVNILTAPGRASGVILFPLVIIYSIYLIFGLAKEYLSEIIVFDDYLELIYRKFNIITSRKKILKNEIEAFELHIKCNASQKRYLKVHTCSRTVIQLNNDETISFSVDEYTDLSRSPYQYILDITALSNQIPNFHYDIVSVNEEFTPIIENDIRTHAM